MIASTRSTLQRQTPPRRRRAAGQRSVLLLAAFWVVASAAVVALGPDRLPFDWPHLPGASPTSQVTAAWAGLAAALVLIGIT